MGRYSKMFSMAINLFGPADLQSFIDYAPTKWKNFLNISKSRISKLVLKNDPTEYANKINQPTILVYGKNDSVTNYRSLENFSEKFTNKKNLFLKPMSDIGHGDLTTSELKKLLDELNFIIKELQ